MDSSEKKRKAAQASLEFIEPGVTLGVGTGSTVNELIELLPTVGERIDTLVSSSRDTTERLRQKGFDVSTLNEAGDVDVYIDGADEATKRLHLIKGGGGALTREKVLAGAARRFVCIVDESKFVGILGRFPLPIEVLPMAQGFVARKLVKLRANPVWREGFVTDNGNHILDVHDLNISNPLEMETRLNQIPGIITVGLFAHRPADILLIADDAGVRELRNWTILAASHSMTLIRWTDAFSLGIDEVDEEHKALIELINGLYDVIQLGADYVQVVELLGEIYSQIAVHFAHEEDMMHESGYSRFEEHREDHEVLLDDLREIMDEVEVDGSFDAVELSSDLNRWFIDHFRTHDARLYKSK